MHDNYNNINYFSLNTHDNYKDIKYFSLNMQDSYTNTKYFPSCLILMSTPSLRHTISITQRYESPVQAVTLSRPAPVPQACSWRYNMKTMEDPNMTAST
jgi:hypothetical protein